MLNTCIYYKLDCMKMYYSLQNGEAGHFREEKHLNLLWLTVFIDTEKSCQCVQLFVPDRSARQLRRLSETLTN